MEKRIKIWVFTVVRNEEQMAPWFLRHYGQFADRILVWDAGSTDRTRQIFAAHPSVSLFDWPGPDGIDEDFNLHFAYDTYPSARGKADWCIWVDCDEFITSDLPLSKSILFSLSRLQTDGIDVARTAGSNMLQPLPPNMGGYWHKQLWEHNNLGVAAPVYSKPVVFRPEAKVRWVRGKHALEDCNPTVSDKPLLKLLHYRYLGANYTARRNAQNLDRCVGDKAAAWSCRPDYTGEHSPAWAEEAMNKSVNVLELPV